MATHKCTQEKEISNLRVAIAEIKESNKSVLEKINSLHEILVGDDGLLKEVKKNREFRIIQEESSKNIKAAIGSGWIIAAIMIALQLITWVK